MQFKHLIIIILFITFFPSLTHTQSDDEQIFSDDQSFQSNKFPKNQTLAPHDNSSPSTTFSRKITQFKLDADTLSYYRYEVLALCCIFIYLILYRIGKSTNIKIIQSFYRKIKHYIELNFSHIGFTKNSGQDPLVAQSPNQAIFYASGRQNIQYLQIKFNLLKRQDFLYHYLYQTIYPQKDLIIIDIPIQINHPIVLCILNKKKLKQITQKYLDLAKLVGTFEIKGINTCFHVLGESAQILDTIFDNNTCKKINDISQLVHSIHYTDQKLFSESEGHLRATLYASSKHEDKYLPALQLLLQLADKIHQLKIPATYKAKAFKARQAFNASVQKQRLQSHKQQLKKKKQQKKKQEQAWLRSLPPQKQKRQDQKRKKKQMNKLLKSRIMKVA